VKRLSCFIITLLLSTVAFSGLSAPLTHAQAANANAAQGLQISPAVVELNGERDKTYTLPLSVLNVTGSDLEYQSAVNAFGVKDETGSPSILVDSKQVPTISVINWVTPIPTFLLHSQEKRSINVSITIPRNAEPGGHYGVVQFLGKAPSVDGTGVGLSASAGTLLLIKVDGDVKEVASIATFRAEQGGKQGTLFESSPVNFAVRVQNSGNIHLKPVGNIEIHNIFGGLVTTLPVNQKKGNVLPTSVRRFETELKEKGLFGKYTADLTLGYGTTGQVLTSQATFWIIPYRLILVGLFVLATAIFILWRLIKAYNKFIIAKAKNEDSVKEQPPKE
jgi:hypothetical protein